MVSLRLSFGFLVLFASLYIPSLIIRNRCDDRLCLSEEHVAFFVFGDSLFDVGGNNYINTTTMYQANFWPYGETFFKYPTGRYSDGRLIPDFIAEYAKLPLIPPYLHPGYHQYTDGANFASAGAGALAETHPGLVIDLKTQVNYFQNVEGLLSQKLGDKQAKTLLSRAVYLFSFGSNDYFAPFIRNSSVLRSYSQEEFVDMVIGNFTTVIKEIYERGGRKFGIVGMLPFGCVPLTKALKPGNEGECMEEITTIEKLHNKALSKALLKLESQLKGFKYSFANLYTSVTQIMENPLKYGFKEGKVACCGSGPYRGSTSCGGKRSVKEYELCENPSEYVFFDSAHPTDRGNEELAKLMWNGNSNVTWPYNLKALFEQL